MMLAIQLLEDDDIIEPTDWCRPLQTFYDGSDWSQLAIRSPYTGAPMNNKQWCKVDEVFGIIWFGKTIKELHSVLNYFHYEFVRGDLPERNILTYNKNTNALWCRNQKEMVRKKKKKSV